MFQNYGEVQILQDDLDRFLNLAQRFKIKGLLANNDVVKKEAFDNHSFPVAEENEIKYNLGQQEELVQKKSALSNVAFSNENEQQNFVESESYIGKLDNGNFECSLCGKVSTIKGNVRRHVETHLDVSYSCHLCGKVFQSKNAQSAHKSRNHK